jgi:hypothetical protein
VKSQGFQEYVGNSTLLAGKKRQGRNEPRVLTQRTQKEGRTQSHNNENGFSRIGTSGMIRSNEVDDRFRRLDHSGDDYGGSDADCDCDAHELLLPENRSLRPTVVQVCLFSSFSTVGCSIILSVGVAAGVCI